LNEGKAEKNISILANVANADLNTFYTGDYDMHDLLVYQRGRYCRILADTPDEHSAIDYFNLGMTAAEGETNRKKIVHGYVEAKRRTYESAYALIRHGAQTSFMSFLHSITGNKDLERWIQGESSSLPILPFESIISIDPNICMFDKEGNAYLLDSLNKIYQYYKNNDLLDRIPFYYFFKDLKGRADYASTIQSYSQIINEYLINCYS
jgi:hypothetical protein